MPVLGFNALLAAVRQGGVRLDPYLSFNFLVEVEGLLVGGFSECTGLGVETEQFEYREGGVNEYAHRFAGTARNPTLVLRRGLTQIDTLWVWAEDVARGKVQRRNGTVFLLDAGHVPVVWWNFREAFPVRWTGRVLTAAPTAVAFESVELAHRGLSRSSVSRAATEGLDAVGDPLSFFGVRF
jgi:phage tail-like protein